MSEDVFRKKYVELTFEQSELIRLVKERSQDLQLIIDSIGRSRETALAITKLEECVMWAVKSITEAK